MRVYRLVKIHGELLLSYQVSFLSVQPSPHIHIVALSHLGT
jgi:hypothetical protein